MWIGSGSMEPIIYTGDAVVLSKVKEDTELKVDDIVAYEEGDKIIVHRIIEIKDDYYITKGDNNNTRDKRNIKREEIKGKFMFRIPYLSYPSLWVGNKIERGEQSE